jgi:hypothetical protein
MLSTTGAWAQNRENNPMQSKNGLRLGATHSPHLPQKAAASGLI